MTVKKLAPPWVAKARRMAIRGGITLLLVFGMVVGVRHLLGGHRGNENKELPVGVERINPTPPSASAATVCLSPGQSIKIDLEKLTAPVRVEVEPNVLLRGKWSSFQPDGAWVKVGINGDETQIITPNGPHRNYTRPPGERGFDIIYPGGKGFLVMCAVTEKSSPNT
jgi:hypothetical protein